MDTTTFIAATILFTYWVILELMQLIYDSVRVMIACREANMRTVWHLTAKTLRLIAQRYTGLDLSYKTSFFLHVAKPRPRIESLITGDFDAMMNTVYRTAIASYLNGQRILEVKASCLCHGLS